MSITAHFLAIDATAIAQLNDNPTSVAALIMAVVTGPPSNNHLAVDTFWHGIHFLLTNTAFDGVPPWSLVVLGGEEIGDDLGYGPARLLNPVQVQAISQALSGLDLNELRSRFQPEQMQSLEIYPTVIWTRDRTESLSALLQNLNALVDFYRAAASQGSGLLIWMI